MKIPKWLTNSIVTALRSSVSASYTLSDPSLLELFRTQDDDTGLLVNEQTAMSLVTFYRGLNILAGTIAGLPFNTFKETTINGHDGKELDKGNPVYFLLKKQPNQWQTPFEFKRLMMAWLILRGNAYAEKIVNGSGVITQLIPRDPDYITAFMAPDGKRAYMYRPPQGKERIILQDEMCHWMNLSLDGIEGVGVIENHARTLGMSIGAEKHGASLYKNGSRPGGVLEHPTKLGPDAHKLLLDSWGGGHQGVDRSHKVAILSEGMTFKPIAMTPQEVQYIETRKFQRGDIAILLGLPPHKVGDLERATFSNIYQQALEFYQDSIMPWAILIEEACNRDLFTESQRLTHFVKFNTNSILRGDLEAKSKYYASAIQNGYISINEVRSLEDMNGIEDGDKYYHQLNMIEVGKEPDPNEIPPTEPDEDDDDIIDDARAIASKRNGVGHE